MATLETFRLSVFEVPVTFIAPRYPTELTLRVVRLEIPVTTRLVILAVFKLAVPTKLVIFAVWILATLETFRFTVFDVPATFNAPRYPTELTFSVVRLEIPVTTRLVIFAVFKLAVPVKLVIFAVWILATLETFRFSVFDVPATFSAPRYPTELTLSVVMLEMPVITRLVIFAVFKLAVPVKLVIFAVWILATLETFRFSVFDVPATFNAPRYPTELTLSVVRLEIPVTTRLVIFAVFKLVVADNIKFVIFAV